jgi:hypothetical protein
MSRRDGAHAVLFVEKPGPLLCHLRAPIVPKLGTHSYGQNLISIELNPHDCTDFADPLTGFDRCYKLLTGLF